MYIFVMSTADTAYSRRPGCTRTRGTMPNDLARRYYISAAAPARAASFEGGGGKCGMGTRRQGARHEEPDARVTIKETLI